VETEKTTFSGTDNKTQATQPQGQSPTTIELWNGFTSGMTENEALVHALCFRLIHYQELYYGIRVLF
jgi:hypothetical protein